MAIALAERRVHAPPPAKPSPMSRVARYRLTSSKTMRLVAILCRYHIGIRCHLARLLRSGVGLQFLKKTKALFLNVICSLQ